MTGRKRQRQSDGAQQPAQDNAADCPFTASVVPDKDRDQKSKKRQKTSGQDDEPKINTQLSPFSPSGTFKTYDTMDVFYKVEPSKRWTDMTRYNSFVCTLFAKPLRLLP
jgi:hypothetical protein